MARYYFKKFDDEGKPIKRSFSIKPKKTKDPAPGSYDVIEAIQKTQWGKSSFPIQKCKNNTFVGKYLPKSLLSIDQYVKSKNYVPGIGKYKEVEKGLNRLSRPISSMRRRR